MNPKPTLQEIAARAGVSPMTVSKVLNGKNKENRPSSIRRAQMIRDIARDLNYHPNAAARAVKTGRHGAIALMQSTILNHTFIFHDTWDAIANSLRHRELHLTYSLMPDEQLRDDEYIPRVLREWSVDGLIINYIGQIPERIHAIIGQHRVPSVWMNTRLPSDCVYPDDRDGARRATEHLLSLGHRRIAYVNYSPSTHYSTRERQDGYRDAMDAAGKEPRYLLGERDSPRADWQAMSFDWLRTTPRPTAVLTYEADEAMAIYCAALRLGLSVPGDLSIIAVHDNIVDRLGIRITTMRLPAAAMGETAVEMVLERIDGDGSPLPSRALPPVLDEGVTCAPPG